MIQCDAPLRLRLDGATLVANWRYLLNQGSAQCGAAVKADGYGLGAREVVGRLRDAGCRDFFVSNWCEAAAIRDLVPPGQISVFSGISTSDIAAYRAIGAIPVLNSPGQIACWRSAGGGRCHVMLDTGINRLGIGPDQISNELLDGLEIDILMSHLACADENGDENREQLASYLVMIGGIQAQRRSLSSSAGIMLGAQYHFDLTRPGLSLYGGIARPEMQSSIRQVAYVQAQILQLRTIAQGAKIGYGGTYICDRPTQVATCAIGYADGYRRCFSNAGSAFFGDVAMPVLGRVSMDLITIDASNCPALQEGDWVDIQFSLADASRQSGLSQYELLTGLGNRFDRSWN
jgi:alanine racemase